MKNKFLKIGFAKIIILQMLTSVYVFYWSYKQWRQLKSADASYSKISPVLRGIFLPFYIFSLCNIISTQYIAVAQDKEAAANSLRNFKVIPFLLFGFLVLFLIYSLTGIGGSPFLYVFMIISALVAIQGTINKCLPPDTKKEAPIKLGDFLLCAAVFLIAGGVMFGRVFYAIDKGQKCLAAQNQVVGSLYKNDCMQIKGRLLSNKYTVSNAKSSIFREELSPVFAIYSVRPSRKSLNNPEPRISDIAAEVLLSKDATRAINPQLLFVDSKNLFCVDITGDENIKRSCYFNQKGLLVTISGFEENSYNFYNFINSLQFNK